LENAGADRTAYMTRTGKCRSRSYCPN